MKHEWIPRSNSQNNTLTIKPKERCAPKIITKIEGSAVEEGCKVFFEGIVDAKPQPKFHWYFNDEPIFPGQKGWEEAEIHDSRRMSTLILKYAREHHMGKYTLVTSNQLGTVECSCDLIVRKKQFPPVFWQRLYNVGDEGSRRFVGGVEVGGWPVPAVFWYKVDEDGVEHEVTSKTHTENWNGNPNKYVPSSRVEVRQIDAIRHCIVFHEVSSGDSGLYRVRAVNCLGEAECEAELNFEDCGEAGGGDGMYLPPLWREKRRLTWRDQDMYDQRKKPFTDVDEPGLTDEELAEMKMKSGVVPLSRITEYFATLPDYKPTDRFRDLERMPYKPGVDEHDYRPDRRGGKVGCFPGKFNKGQIVHRGYVSDTFARILPWWYNPTDPNARDSSDWRWKSVHPDLFVPELAARSKSPDPPPVWETTEDIRALILLLRSMGSRVEDEVAVDNRKTGNISASSLGTDNKSYINQKSETRENTYQAEQKNTNVKKSSSTVGINKTEESTGTVVKEQGTKTSDVRKMWEQKLDKNVSAQQSNSTDFTAQFLSTKQTSSTSSKQWNSQIYQKQENLSFPELEKLTAQPPPALPPKTKIRNSPSRNIFSPTESVENGGTGMASIKSVEFLPVKEKVKLIAAQQEELLKKEETAEKTSEYKQKGVRILPPSPVTVRKMSVEEELHNYDMVVTRSTPTTGFMETPPPRPDLPDLPIYQEVRQSKEQTSKETTEPDYSTIDSGISHSMASSSYQMSSSQQMSSMQTSQQQTSSMQETQQQISTMSSQQTSSFMEQRSSEQTFSSTSYSTEMSSRTTIPGWSNSPVLNAEEQKQKEELLQKMESKHGVDKALDQLIAETESLVTNDNLLFQQKEQHQSSSQTVQSNTVTSQKTSLEMATDYFANTITSSTLLESPAEECRRSFEEAELEAMALESQSNASISKQSSMVESASVQSFVYQKEDKSESEASFQSRKPMRSQSTAYIRAPSTFTHAQPPSCPTTPMSQRRRLRINQSPKPPEDQENKPKYREGNSSPFQPGFYRPPPEEYTSSNPIFKLIRRNNSRGNLTSKEDTTESTAQPSIRVSQASSKAYEGDSES